MKSHLEPQTPFESPSSVLIHWRLIRRWLRNALLVLVTIVLFVEWIGEPLVRWEYRYRGSQANPVITDATYVGFSGQLESSAYQHGEGCPLILFVKPATPLWRQAIDRLTALSTHSIP